MQYILKEPILPREENNSLIDNVFLTRGIPVDEKNHYINTTKEDLFSPDQIDNIRNGVIMLIQHIYKNDKIFLIVDCDVDGYSSAALLLNYLNRFFPGYVQNYISYQIHDGKQHGIENDFIPKIIKDGYKMVICPDSSSNDYEQHKYLKEHGIDILVIDHHEAEYVSNDACIINNQLCDYPNKTLSGVGMVYKFCCYIDELYDRNDANDFLDLAAVGIISDMMPINNFETKYIITEGLKNINNPFLREIIRIQDYIINKAGGLCPFTVSFYIAPLINATIRMGTYEEKILLFKSMLEFCAYNEILSTKRGYKGQMETIVEQAGRNCGNIKKSQTKTKDQSLEMIKNLIETNHLDKNKIILVQLPKDSDIDKNITGLIANNLMADYQHPVLVLHESYTPEGEKSWEGSGRGYVAAGLQDFKQFLKDSGYAVFAEGHSNAFGFSILDKDINDFINYSNKKLADYDFTPCYKVDAICNINNINQNEITKVAEYSTIWGQDMEQPYFVFTNIRINPNNISLLSPNKSPTLKISLSSGLSLIKFKSSQDEYESLLPSNNYETITISVIGICCINEWDGQVNPQIEIKDYEITSKGYVF